MNKRAKRRERHLQKPIRNRGELYALLSSYNHRRGEANAVAQAFEQALEAGKEQ